MIEKPEIEIISRWKTKDCEMLPLVSIRCIAYNHEQYIEKTLDGFLMQETDFPFEIVIHDDASTDRTADIIRSYEKRYPQIIKPIYEDENQYSKHDGSLRRVVNRQLKGKYVAFCEGDDYWINPHKLQKQADFMEKHPEYSLVYHPVYYITGEEIVSDDRKFEGDRDISTDEIIVGGGLFCSTLSLFFLTEHLLDQRKFQKMADVGDYPLQILLSLKGKVRYIDDIMGCYRYGSSGSWTERINQDERKLLKHYRTEILWLRELDCETGGVYQNSIYYRIGLMGFQLLKKNKMKASKYMIIARRSGRLYGRELRWQYYNFALRQEIKYRHKWMYQLYVYIKQFYKHIGIKQ